MPYKRGAHSRIRAILNAPYFSASAPGLRPVAEPHAIVTLYIFNGHTMPVITVQTDDFDLTTLYQQLRAHAGIGAIVTFTGLVREFSGHSEPLTLEHYPGMTEKSLHSLYQEACARWPIEEGVIVHRVGKLSPSEQIVFVGIASAHRAAAFEAAQFLMDQLKTKAPFWKKEGDRWVDAKASDQHAASTWY